MSSRQGDNEQFRQETQLLHHHRVYYILLVGMAVMLLFTALDYIMAPEFFAEFLLCRLFACGIGALLMVFNYFDRELRNAWIIGFAGYICASAVIVLMIMRMGEITSPYYVGLLVIMTSYTAIAPLTAPVTLISGFSLVCMYLAGMYFLEPPSLSLFSNLFFMVCFVCIAATQSWADTAARARECDLRIAEKSAADKLADQADNLEIEVRKRIAEQEASERRFKLLYEAITDDIVLVTPEGDILQENESFQQHFGDIGGSRFIETVSQKDQDKAEEMLAEVIEHGRSLNAYQLTLCTQTGATIAAEINGVLLMRSNKVLGVQLVIRDISIRRNMEGMLFESLKKVRQTENAAILALAKLSEYRDTSRHSNHLERIREYCRILAIELSRRAEFQEEITPAYIQNLYQGAILHDIGNVAIADDIMENTGSLTEKEQETLRNHTLRGGDVIKAMEEEARGSGFLSLAKSIAYFHHERWDGGGFPYGLRGNEIPLAARIMTLADAYDELTTAIDCEHASIHQEALESIVRNAGLIFDPAVVEALVARQKDFDRVRLQLAETG